MKREKEKLVSIRPLNEADLEMVWHLRFKAPDQSYRKWNAPYFHEHEIPLAAFKNDTYRIHPFRQSYMVLK